MGNNTIKSDETLDKKEDLKSSEKNNVETEQLQEETKKNVGDKLSLEEQNKQFIEDTDSYIKDLATIYEKAKEKGVTLERRGVLLGVIEKLISNMSYRIETTKDEETRNIYIEQKEKIEALGEKIGGISSLTEEEKKDLDEVKSTGTGASEDTYVASKNIDNKTGYYRKKRKF